MSDPEDSYPKYVMFNRLVATHQWARAREVGQELLSVDPENPGVLESMAQANIQLSNPEQGLLFAEKALQLNPDSHYALFLISLVQSDRNQDTQAGESISRAIEMEPHVALYWRLRAHYSYKRKRFKDAKNFIEEAIRLDPMDADSLSFDVQIDQAIDEYDMTPADDYIARLEKALELEPENTDVLNNIGVLYLNEKKDYPTAEMFFRRALAIDPHTKITRDNLLNAIRHQDALFRVLYFPRDYGVMPIFRLFQICWAKKWPLIFLIFVAKYLIAIAVAVFLFWAVCFYPLIFVYRWMTLVDIRRKSNDYSLRLPEWTLPFFRLSRPIRMGAFFGVWVLIWAVLGLCIYSDYTEQIVLNLMVIVPVIAIAGVWIRHFIRLRANRS